MVNKASIAFDGEGDLSEDLGDYIALLKPRVMSLSIFTAICGILMAPGHIHPFLGFITVLCISVGAGASGCLNMWYDRDIDAVMKRTKDRPLPAGSKKVVAKFLSVNSIVIAPANTGTDKSNRKAVTNIAQTNSGIL